jgi:NDP-sugar pyrophosphorylase family protein
VEYLVLRLERTGFRTIVFASGHRSGVVRRYFGDGRRWGVSIHYSEERQPLGTAGALRRAVEQVQAHRFLIANGDSFFDIDPRRVLDLVSGDITMSMALVRVADPGRFGRVDQAPDGMVVGFVQNDKRPGPAVINAGIYGARREILDMIPPNRSVSLEREVLPELAGHSLCGLSLDGFFIDIGLPETYLALRANPEPLLNAVGVQAVS